MSIEAFPYYYPGDFFEEIDASKEIDPTAELPFRVHHLWQPPGKTIYQAVLQDLVEGDIQNLQNFCLEAATIHVNGLTEPPAWRQKSFREFHGYSSDDESVPVSYLGDVIGNDVQSAIAERTERYSEFLTLPDSTPIAIGPGIDRVCEGCFFNKGTGKGGLHCQLIDLGAERYSARQIHKQLREFLDDKVEDEVKLNDPNKYRLKKRLIEIPSEYKVEPDNNGSRSFGIIVTSLGLLRDMMTYRATIWSDRIYYSYKEFIDRKGLGSQIQRGNTIGNLPSHK
jgi:hypothetical protein